ncbi:MAG: rod shape-determining protein RodA [Thermoleophilia bacterium]
MELRDYLRHLDYLLLAITAGLVSYGVTAVYYATRSDIVGKRFYYAQEQLLYAAVGTVALLLVTVVDYQRWRRWQWLLYAFAVLSNVIVLGIGAVTRGSKRWIRLPFMNFQPSQLALWIITVCLAAFLVDRMDLLGTKKVTLMAIAYVALPAAFVFIQPDFGTSMIFVAILFALLLFYGTNWRQFAILGASVTTLGVLVLAVLPAMHIHVIKQYQMDRLLVFLNPTHDPQAGGYNIIQSMIAVGSGSLHGQGNQATQTTLNFLPEHQTDFIFAVVSERWGFLGALLLIALYGLLVWRALRIATLAHDVYGSLIAGGIAVAMAFQVFVNIGMSIGIMPVTGIPLPFISYGGSSMITNLMLVGLLESVHLRARFAPGPGRL